MLLLKIRQKQLLGTVKEQNVSFACGGGVGNSVMKQQRVQGKKVIGVDVNQYCRIRYSYYFCNEKIK